MHQLTYSFINAWQSLCPFIYSSIHQPVIINSIFTIHQPVEVGQHFPSKKPADWWDRYQRTVI